MNYIYLLIYFYNIINNYNLYTLINYKYRITIFYLKFKIILTILYIPVLFLINNKQSFFFDIEFITLKGGGGVLNYVGFSTTLLKAQIDQ
jgi:hypothetical protein